MKTLRYTLAIIIALILLIFIEGMATLGQAFEVKNYGVLGYIFQTLVISATIIGAILWQHDTETNKKAS